jgi:hypothetical protein
MALDSAEHSEAIHSQASSNGARLIGDSSNGASTVKTKPAASTLPLPPTTLVGKTLGSKAHAATIRRLVERYGVQPGVQCDLLGSDWVIEVETAATVAAGIQKLLQKTGRRFVAMTNRESIQDALELTKATDIGVMSPKGDIVKEAGMGSEAAA